MLLLLWKHLQLLVAAARCKAGLVKVWALLLMLRLERMGLAGMKGELVPPSAPKHFSHSGPVKARLTSRAFTLEHFQGAVGTTRLSAHFGGAWPFVRGLHLSIHPGAQRSGAAACRSASRGAAVTGW